MSSSHPSIAEAQARYEQVRCAFATLCDLRPAEQNEQLASICGHDPAIMNDVAELLAFDGKADSTAGDRWKLRALLRQVRPFRGKFMGGCDRAGWTR